MRSHIFLQEGTIAIKENKTVPSYRGVIFFLKISFLPLGAWILFGINKDCPITSWHIIWLLFLELYIEFNKQDPREEN